MLLIAPVAIILVAENLGHIKAVGAMTGRNLDPYIGRAFLGDGVATMVAGCGGGTGVTTYAENIGVMAATKIYSTAIFVVAAADRHPARLLAQVRRADPGDPAPGAWAASRSCVFGLIAVAGGRIWVENKVDFANPQPDHRRRGAHRGAGDFTLKFGEFALGGIGTATFGAIILYQILTSPLARRAE